MEKAAGGKRAWHDDRFSDARHGYMLTNRILGAQKEPFLHLQKKGSQRRISVCGLADQTAKWRKKQDGINSLKKRIKKWWQELTIQKKIAVFTGMVCVAILLSVVFNVWVVRFSLTDFNGILQDNAKCSELIQALEQESTLFESYMRNPDTEKKEALERSMKRTNMRFMICHSSIAGSGNSAMQKHGRSAAAMKFIALKEMQSCPWKIM